MTNDKSQMTNFVRPPRRSAICQSVPAAARSFRRAASAPNPADAGCNSKLAQYSNTPSLRVAGFEDEDENEAPHEGDGSLPIPDSTDSRHRRGLTQAHIAIVLHVINQPLGDTRAALASGESSLCGGSILVVRTFLGVSIILGIPVRLVAIRVTKFVEKEGERERKTPAHISGFRRMYRAKQGAKTEKENRNFFHRGTGSPVVLHKPDKKGSAPARPVSHFNTIL